VSHITIIFGINFLQVALKPEVLPIQAIFTQTTNLLTTRVTKNFHYRCHSTRQPVISITGYWSHPWATIPYQLREIAEKKTDEEVLKILHCSLKTVIKATNHNFIGHHIPSYIIIAHKWVAADRWASWSDLLILTFTQLNAVIIIVEMNN